MAHPAGTGSVPVLQRAARQSYRPRKQAAPAKMNREKNSITSLIVISDPPSQCDFRFMVRFGSDFHGDEEVLLDDRASAQRMFSAARRPVEHAALPPLENVLVKIRVDGNRVITAETRVAEALAGRRDTREHALQRQIMQRVHAEV